MDDAPAIDDLVARAHRAALSRLVVASSGNFSARLAGGRLAISGSGIRLDSLDRASVAVVGIDDGETAGEPAPSMEVGLHRAVYRVRPDVGAVLHFQSPAATAISCSVRPRFELDFIPEVPAYVGPIEMVPYLHPGTPELAGAVARAAERGTGNLIVLLGHGQVALGADPATALRNAEVFELACDIACRGIELRRYDEATVSALRRYGR